MNKTTKKKPTGAHQFDYQAAASRPLGSFRWVRWGIALLTAAGLIAAAWHITRMRQNRSLGGLSRAVMTPGTVSSAHLTALYRDEICPLLDAALKRDRQAADRAIESLHERFNAHRAGVKPFAQEVSGWGTRLGVVGRYAGDTWDHFRGNPRADAVGDYVQGMFRSHVLSERSLQSDVEETLKQYREDLEASRNRLFAEIKLPLRGGQSPIIVDDKNWGLLCADIDKRAKELNAAIPRASVVTGLASVAGGWVGTETAQILVTEILTGVGTSVAAEAAETAAVAGGSATVGGTASGGGVGSLGGPAGTAIGVGVGLAVGAAIDWWASDRLEAHVGEQCDKFLDTIEHQLIDGGGNSPGLRAAFEQAAKRADQTQRQAILSALLEVRQ